MSGSAESRKSLVLGIHPRRQRLVCRRQQASLLAGIGSRVPLPGRASLSIAIVAYIIAGAPSARAEWVGTGARQPISLVAPALVSFELTEEAVRLAKRESPPGIGISILTPDEMVAGLRDETLGLAFDSLGVLEVRPYFVRPDRMARSKQESRLSRIFQAFYVSGTPPEAAAKALCASNSVQAASAVPLRVVAGLPNDPKFGLQWGFHQSSDFDMDLPEAWDVSVGDSAITLAVVDTGMDRENPDLGGPSVWDAGNVWVNLAEAGGIEGLDDDSNGYVDDVWGWDWVDYVGGDPAPWPGEDFLGEDNDPYDFHGHGTAVAGVAGALADNAEGIAGFLWRCRIMGLRAGLTVQVGSQRLGIVRMDWCARAVAYAADMGVAAINASWESGFDVGLEAAVDYAISNGVIMVVAAGNRGTSKPDTLRKYNYLSTRGDCIDVGGVQRDGLRWGRSNYGPWVDVSAPAAGVITLGYSPPDVRGYWYRDGTSFAAPAVAALAALVKWTHHDWDAEQIRAHIMATSLPLDPPDPAAGSGVANAFEAVRQADGGWRISLEGSAETRAVPVEGPRGISVIAAGLSGGRACAWSVSGEPAAGWPVALGDRAWNGIAAGDVDGDGESEIVLVDAEGAVVVLGDDGSQVGMWEAGSAPIGEPVLVDVNNDASSEILLATDDRLVHAWTYQGTSVSGWPVELNSSAVGAPAAGDLDGDESVEVVVATGDGTLHCLSSAGADLPGWPVHCAVAFAGPPSLGDVGGDDERLEVVAAAVNGYLYSWDSGGDEVAGWPFRACAAGAAGGVSLGDIDADGIMEAAVVCSDRDVAVCDARGFVEEGWPAAAGGPVHNVLFSDVDGDSSSDVVCTVVGVGVSAWDAKGVRIANWPKPTDGAPSAGASLGDLDGDGRTEVVAPSGEGWLHCWDLSSSPYVHRAALWPLSARTPGNTRLAALAAGVNAPTGNQGLGTPLPFRVTYVAASQSPFHHSTEILSRLEGPNGARERTVLDVFDVAGRAVRRLASAPREPGLYRDLWDGKDQRGMSAPPGVYVCRVRVGESALYCRVVLLP